MTTTQNTQALPTEMTDALQNVLREASKVQADVERIIDTATKWLANTEAYPFPMSGCATRDMAELEMAIARYEAFRSIAYKITAADTAAAQS